MNNIKKIKELFALKASPETEVGKVIVGQKEIINQPICDICYNELRLILIEKESDAKSNITASNLTINTMFL